MAGPISTVGSNPSADVSGQDVMAMGGTAPSGAIVALAVSADGTILVSEAPAGEGTAALTAVASSITSGVALAANAARAQVIMTNTDAYDCYVKFGATASATSFTYIVPGGGGVLEYNAAFYKGAIHAIWAGDGAGSLYITEVSA